MSDLHVHYMNEIELEQYRSEVVKKQKTIENELHKANLDYRLTGKTSDPLWYYEHKTALRNLEATRSAINSQLLTIRLTRKRKKETKNKDYNALFVEVANEILMPDLLQHIEDGIKHRQNEAH